MPTSLTEAASSGYIAARNAMNPSARPQVWIYVEGQDDVVFWHGCLASYDTAYDFRISVYKIPSGTKQGCTTCGKSHLLESFDLSSLGRNMLLAIDADYDWLINDYRPSEEGPSYSRLIRDNEYILHTYLYSIENYHSHHSTVNDIFLNATNVGHSTDIAPYLAKVSEAIAPLFLIHLASIDLNDKAYPLAEFKRDLSQVKFDLKSADISSSGKEHIKSRTAAWKAYSTANHGHISRLEDKLSDAGFTCDKYYLLMHGHTVWNSIVKDMLQKVIYNCRKEKMAELQSHPLETEREKQVRQYCRITGIGKRNRPCDITARIEQLASDCLNIPQVTEGFRLIKRDIDRLFGVSI